jgi:hypothetical protein
MAVAALRKASPEVRVHGQQTGGPVSVEVVDDTPAAPQITESTDAAGRLVISIGGDGIMAGEPPARDGKFDANLADGMDMNALGALASYLLDGIDADLQSRKDWEETANRAADFLGIKLQDPTTSVSADGTVCKAVSTVMLEAAARLWGVARAELLPVSGPVKVRRDDVPEPQQAAAPGQPPPPQAAGIPGDQSQGDMDDLADALEKDLNWYLTVGDREYYPDFSKMIFHRALIGNAFRKVYRCPLKRKPVSVWVKAQDLIVSNDCAHLSGAGRVTERIRYRQATMRRLQASGHYLDVALVQPTGQTTDTEVAVSEAEGIVASPALPDDFEHLVYECYCEIGSGTTSSLIGDLSELDRDENGRKPGFPLPYRVSIDLDSRTILEIRRNWKQDDEDYTPRRRYVKYGFLPGFGFYDFGLIHIVGNPTQVATMIQRSCVDSSLLANFPAFLQLIGPTSRQTNTVIRPGPGEVIGINGAGAQAIGDALMPMPYKPPSAEAMALGSKVENDAKRLAGVLDIPVGEGRIGNTPVGTIMSYIESVSQVPGAVHKDDHISQQDEFDMLRELLAEDPAVLTRGNKRPSRQWQIADELLQPDLIPAADPNTPSQIHRLMKVQGLIMLGGLPQFQGIANNRAIFKHASRVLAGANSDEFEMPQQQAAPPPPDPRIVAAQIKAKSDTDKAQVQQQTETQKHQERMAEIQSEGQEREADRQSAETRAAMSLEAAKVKAVSDGSIASADRMHSTANAAADRAQEHAHHVEGQQQAATAAAQQPAAEEGE